MTLTQKPRIKRDYSLKLDRMQWFCRGSGHLGFSDTPMNAYRIWIFRMRDAGKIEWRK